jgi:hypothetical protein
MPKNHIPRVYQEYLDFWQNPAQRQASLEAYTQGRQSFVLSLIPEQALQLSVTETLEILRGRFGSKVEIALHPDFTNSESIPDKIPTEIQSPVANQPNGEWLKHTNMVGINVRTVGSFWNIIPYALTLPEAQDAIHILPIWEPGVAGSMYGISSWNLNPEFYSAELAEAVPTLISLGRQLRAVINLLHLMGKTAGMDVIPHTDRFSQIALAYPDYFEWLQRQDTLIVDHRTNLHKAAQKQIGLFLLEHGPAVAGDRVPENLFDPEVEEETRLRLLFGLPEDFEGRDARRNQIIQRLYRYGLEPVPATMAPPFRGLAVDTRPEAKNVDAHGQVWRDYVIEDPEPMSRVFGPLGRYKLYESKANNANWELDFERPRIEVWDYICRKYQQVQDRYGFDFMRGDMSHVQMRPAGVPAEIDRYYDILGAVKQYIQAQGVPYFGYFAETFLAPRDVMGYGEEIDHLEAAEAEVTLGDLQSMVVGSTEFLQNFRRYDDLRQTRRCAPSFTVMTADKDDPRFDEFYLGGNALRLFIALFLTQTPSYMALGFETRDRHYNPAPNEHYTKLFVFQERSGPKATHGPYMWGHNAQLFGKISAIRQFADSIWEQIQARPMRWLLPPDATAHNKVIAWTQADTPEWVFVANLDIHQSAGCFGLPQSSENFPAPQLKQGFSTEPALTLPEDEIPHFNGKHYQIQGLQPGEGRVYKVLPR